MSRKSHGTRKIFFLFFSSQFHARWPRCTPSGFFSRLWSCNSWIYRNGFFLGARKQRLKPAFSVIVKARWKAEAVSPASLNERVVVVYCFAVWWIWDNVKADSRSRFFTKCNRNLHTDFGISREDAVIITSSEIQVGLFIFGRYTRNTSEIKTISF